MIDTFGKRMEELAKQLVRIRSVVGTEGELDIISFIKRRLSAHPYFSSKPSSIALEPVEHDLLGRSALIVRVSPKAGLKQAVFFLGHTDTVGMSDFASAERYASEPDTLPEALAALKLDEEAASDLASGGYIFGRGIFDMKAGLAAMILLAEELAERSEQLLHDYVFAFVPDEEAGSKGMLAAVRHLARLSRDEGLSFIGAVDIDYMTDRFQGDTRKYIYFGTVGKLLPCVYVHGQATHVGEAFNGIDANFLAARIMLEINLDPSLCDTASGETSPPPVSLRMKDLKKEYSVQTCDAAVLYFNFPTHSRTPDAVLALVKERTAKAMGEALEEISKRKAAFTAVAEHLGENAASEPLIGARVVRVLTFKELVDEARASSGDMADEALKSFAIKRKPDAYDSRDYSLDLVRQLHRLLPDQSAKAVVFFSPPYHPHIAADSDDAKDKRLLSAVTKATEEAKRTFPYEIELKKFYPYISDLSYCRLPKEKEALASLMQNMPAWPHEYSLPLDDIRELSMPVVNIGPYGKDAHKPTERLSRAYSLDAVPFMLRRLVAILEEGS